MRGSGWTTRPVLVITRPISPRPVTPAVQEAYRKQRDAEWEARLRRAEQAGRRLTVLGSPEPRYYPELPVIQALSATWEGRVWVQRRSDEWDGDGPIDVLTAAGDYIGTFPAGTTALPDGMAAFIELDEFHVASVVVRRLPAAVRCAEIVTPVIRSSILSTTHYSAPWKGALSWWVRNPPSNCRSGW